MPEAWQRALSFWEGLADAEVEPVTGGLINQTFRVETARGRYALQRVSPIFDRAVVEDIEAVTEHLRARGLPTPELVRTRDAARYAEIDGEIWRLMTWVHGASFAVARSPAQLASAGRLLGRFHTTLDDLDHAFAGQRLGVHDTPAHLRRLAEAPARHRDHRLYDAAAPLAEAIVEAGIALPPLPEAPPRICHGDLKLSNVRFAGPEPPEAERAVCLIDLDTMGPMALAHELGDALRSWCNPRREDEPPSFELPLMAAAVEGYREGIGRPFEPEEIEAIRVGIEHVCLELAARFGADALEETYFAHDADRYPARGEHNLARAKSMWTLYRAVVACRSEREALL